VVKKIFLWLITSHVHHFRTQKIYVEGKIHPIHVAMREIQLSPTKLSNGKMDENPPVTIYDTSGPYTDENF
jgi:phosphomethylpyrimidine synthase